MAESLCKAAEEARLLCSASGASANLGSRTLEASATVESFISLEPSSFGGNQFPGEVQLSITGSLSVDGEPLLSALHAHSGSDMNLETARAKALDACVSG